MIQVFQTRYTTETLGNCFEACVASILELPLSRVPQRADFVDLDEWRDLVGAARDRGGDRAVIDLLLPESIDGWDDAFRDWLAEIGLGWLDIEIDRRFNPATWLTIADELGGYWIGVHRTEGESAHAVVYHRREIVHNPHRAYLDAEGLDELIAAHVLIAADPPKVARLAPMLLPDVAGQVEAARAEAMAAA